MIINGDGGCRFWQPVLQADSQPKSSGLVLGRRRSTFVKWTGWTLAMALPWRQHYKHCLGYYYYYYYYITVIRCRYSGGLANDNQSLKCLWNGCVLSELNGVWRSVCRVERPVKMLSTRPLMQFIFLFTVVSAVDSKCLSWPVHNVHKRTTKNSVFFVSMQKLTNFIFCSVYVSLSIKVVSTCCHLSVCLSVSLCDFKCV